MNARVPRIWHLVIKGFQDFDHALRAAKSYKKQLQKECTEHNYSAIYFVGVSENDSAAGEIRVGYRGRKEFVQTDTHWIPPKYYRHRMLSQVTEPHLHIILFSSPGETLKEFTRDYFQGIGLSFWEVKNFNNDVYSMLRYTMRQSRKSIRGYANVNGLPQAALNEFIRYAESINKAMNANKPVFQGLTISEDYFRADASVLEEECHNELFTEICLTPKQQIKYGYAEQSGFNIMSSLNTATHNSMGSTVCRDNNELFTGKEVPHHNATPEKCCNINEFSHIDHSSNHGSELRYNNIYNINNTCNTDSPYKYVHRGNKTSIPPNVIDGFIGFLDMIFPSIIPHLDTS